MGDTNFVWTNPPGKKTYKNKRRYGNRTTLFIPTTHFDTENVKKKRVKTFLTRLNSPKTSKQNKTSHAIKALSILYVFYHISSMCYISIYAKFKISLYNRFIAEQIQKSRILSLSLWVRSSIIFSFRLSLTCLFHRVNPQNSFFNKTQISIKRKRKGFYKMKNYRTILKENRKKKMKKIFLFQNHPT